MTKKVTIVGMGLSPEDLTEAYKKVIREADILMGGERLLAFFEDTKAVKKAVTRDLTEAMEFIRSHMKDHAIVVLASGDPLFFGIGAWIVKSLGPDRVEVLPNVSSVAAAFARIREPWSHAKVVSLHGRDREPALLEALRTHECVALLTDPEKNPSRVARLILSEGFEGLEMAVFERLGTPEEKIGWFGLKEAAAMDFQEPNVVILKRTGPSGGAPLRLHLGMEEEVFNHEGGLITKPEIRAVSLAKLSLLPGHVLWDLGAGSGSVAVEASLLLREGRIIAVEQKAERVEQIRQNIRRFGLTGIQVVQAVLPDGLEELPAPDRVFVGGGGRQLGRIITSAAAALKPGGVMVINAVLLDNIRTALSTLEEFGFTRETVQVQIHRTRVMPFSERLEAQNPVWIITGKKEA